MTNLPENWVIASFDEVVEVWDSLRKPINSKEREKRISYKSKRYPYYGATGQVGFIDDFLSDGEYILLGEDGAPFLELTSRKAYKINGKCWVNNHAHLLKSKTNNDFLLFYLNQFDYHGYVTGTTRYKLTQSDMRKIPIPLPPLAEQGRIVQKIEELFAEIDAGIENLKIVKNQIKLYRQSVLKNAFNQDCEKKFLKNYIAEMNYGTSEKTNDDKNGIPVLRMGDIQNGKLNFDNLKFLDTIKDGKLILKKGDLLFNRTNSSELVGKSAVFKADRKCSFASYIIKVRFDDTLNSDYVCFYINSPYGRQWARSQLTQQVGQANINGKKLQELQIPVPSLAEQERIVAEIETRFERADAMELAVQNALDTAEKLKQAILKKAFRGELVPQNPNDEPASVLLERIRAQRTAEEKKTKGKSRS